MIRILVVEDDEGLCQMIKLALEFKIKDVEAICEVNSMFAIKAIEEIKYDLISLDLMMSHANGYEVLKQIRRSKNKDTPVIAITAKNTVVDRKDMIDAGFDDILIKTFDLETLLTKVEYWLNHGRD